MSSWTHESEAPDSDETAFGEREPLGKTEPRPEGPWLHPMCSLVLCSPRGPESLTAQPARHPPGAGGEPSVTPTNTSFLTLSEGAVTVVCHPLWPTAPSGCLPFCLAGVKGGPIQTPSDGHSGGRISDRGDSRCPSQHITCPSGPSHPLSSSCLLESCSTSWPVWRRILRCTFFRFSQNQNNQKEKNFFDLELNKIILEEMQKFSICYYQIESQQKLGWYRFAQSIPRRLTLRKCLFSL